mgnify:CR=1 FL=1
MMKRVCFYLFSALLIIFISSCSSTRSMKKGVSIGNLSESEYMEELISRDGMQLLRKCHWPLT